MVSHKNYGLIKSSVRRINKRQKRKYKNNLYPAFVNMVKGEVYGYIDEDGNWIISPKFDLAYDFSGNSVAVIRIDNMEGLIDKLGEYIIKPCYDSISMFKEGRSVVSKDGRSAVISEEGNIITSKTYGIIGDFHDERAIVGNSKSGDFKYGYIDRSGKESVHLKYKGGDDYKDGVALVKIKDNKYGLIDKQGTMIFSYNYFNVFQYGDGLMSFSKEAGGLYGYINKEGKEIIKPAFTSAGTFEDGIAVVSSEEDYNGPYGVINKRGKYIYMPIFSEIYYLGEGMIALGMPIGKPLGDDKFIAPSIFAIGGIDGKLLTTFKYLNVGKFKDGIAYASDNTTTFFIDKSGRMIKDLPRVRGSGSLELKDNIVYADIDYSPYYLTRAGKIIYKPNDEIVIDDKILIIREKYKPNYNFLIYIPQVNGIKNKRVSKKINNKLRTLSYFKPFAEEQINHSISENDILDYSYYGRFSIEFYKKDLLILNLSGYYYPLGAAHGLSSRITPVINIKSGEFYSIEDLFIKGSEWKIEINTIINTMIKSDKKYADVYEDGFKGVNEGQNFYLDYENLYVYYQPYDIGPYSAGFITFKIPFNDIGDIINKDSELYKAFK